MGTTAGTLQSVIWFTTLASHAGRGTQATPRTVRPRSSAIDRVCRTDHPGISPDALLDLTYQQICAWQQLRSSLRFRPSY